MFAATSLGVFDRLEKSPATAAELASNLGANVDALERLLDACIGLALLTRDGKVYANTPASSVYLCSSSPRRLTGYVNYSDAVGWKLWDNLADAVREGTHRWKQTYGQDGPIFSHFFRNEHDRREFLMGMHGQGMLSSPAVADAFDLSRFRRLADLGGATGHLAVAACKRWPQLHAIVFDLPMAVPLATELVGASGVGDRVEIVAGDFFVDPLPVADIYTLGRIIHDWADDKIHRLLTAIYERLPSGGALLVAEKMLDDDKTGPSWAVMQSLNMLVCTEGKERTLGEYRELLQGIGFAKVEGRRTESPLDAILAIKA
jgi:acetylserotonin N-methyltransferase